MECSGGLGSAFRLCPALDLDALTVWQLELWYSTRQDCTGLGRAEERGWSYTLRAFIVNLHFSVLRSGFFLGWGELGVEKYANHIAPGCNCAITYNMLGAFPSWSH